MTKSQVAGACCCTVGGGTRRGTIHAHLDCLCYHYLSCGRARRLLGPPREGGRPRAVETRLTRHDTTRLSSNSLPAPARLVASGYSFWQRSNIAKLPDLVFIQGKVDALHRPPPCISYSGSHEGDPLFSKHTRSMSSRDFDCQHGVGEATNQGSPAPSRGY